MRRLQAGLQHLGGPCRFGGTAGNAQKLAVVAEQRGLQGTHAPSLHKGLGIVLRQKTQVLAGQYQRGTDSWSKPVASRGKRTRWLNSMFGEW